MQRDTARRIERHGWGLLRLKLMKARDQTVLLWMLWRARRPGQWVCAPTYAEIAKGTGMCRDQAIKAVRRLIGLGLLTKERRHVLVRWGRNRAQVAARQVANLYAFCLPSKESSGQAAESRDYIDRRGSDRLEKALARLGSTLSTRSQAPLSCSALSTAPHH